MMKASIKFGLIMLFIGIASGTAITWAFGPFGDAQVHILEGYTTAVNLKGTAIGLSVPENPDEAGKGYDITGAIWREHGGPWNWDKSPTCLKPLTSNQKVRPGIVNVASTQVTPASGTWQGSCCLTGVS